MGGAGFKTGQDTERNNIMDETITGPSQLAAALAEFHKSLPEVGKGSTNPAFHSRYADLADIVKVVLPALAAQGLAWIATPRLTADGGFVLAYELRHTSGESVAGEWPLPDPSKAKPHELGSAVTYAKRYTLSAVTGIAPDEDDDGNAASAKGAPRAQGRPTAQQKAADLTARINTAAAALDQARTLAELDSVWKRVERGGLAGIERLKSQHEDLKSDLAGTDPVDVDAAWAPSGDPGAATELANDEYEAQVSAEFDKAMALGDA